MTKVETQMKPKQNALTNPTETHERNSIVERKAHIY